MKMQALLNPGRIIALAHVWRHATHSSSMDSDYESSVRKFLHTLSERNIPFVIVGGIALLQHIPGRNTEDIDIILSSPNLTRIPEIVVSERNNLFAKAAFGSLRVDVLLTDFPLFDRVFNDFSKPMPYDVGSLPTATIDGLILLKLFALPSLYRQFDLDRVTIYEADITQLLSRSTQPDSFFLKILQSYSSESDVAQLSGILGEIRTKLAKLKR